MKGFLKDKVANKILNAEILFNCLANIEYFIDEYVYRYKKFVNDYTNNYYGEASRFMHYRYIIYAVLKHHYSNEEIKQMVEKVNPDEVCSDRMRNKVINLIKSKDYKYE